jgi:Tfp pilus assembly protein PilF/DNA-binding CsgD family transcriptional regulator
MLLLVCCLMYTGNVSAQETDLSNRIQALIGFTERNSEFELKASLDSLDLALKLSKKQKDIHSEMEVLRRLSYMMLTKFSNIEEAYRFVDEIQVLAVEHPEFPEIQANYHSALGSIYFYELTNAEKAFVEFEKSMAIVENQSLPDDPLLLNNYGLALLGNNKASEAVDLFHLARGSFQTNKYTFYKDAYLVKNAINIGICHIHLNQLDSAELYFRRARELADATFEQSDDMTTTIYLAIFLQEQKKYDEALQVFNQAKQLNPAFVPYNDLMLLHQGLAELYADQGKFDEAYSNELISRLYQDSIRQKGLEEKAIAMDYVVKIDALKHKQSIDELEREYDRERFKRQISLILLLLIVVVILALFWLYRVNKHKQISAIKAENEALEKERIAQEAELKLLRKDEQLISANVEISVRESELNVLKSNLENHLNKNHDPQFNELRQFLKQVKQSQRKTEQLQHLDQVLSLTNNVFYGRIKKLYPKLSDDEIRLITLIRLNLSSEELLLVFNITKSSLNTKRYRVRKKIGLSSDQSLEEYVMNI